MVGTMQLCLQRSSQEKSENCADRTQQHTKPARRRLLGMAGYDIIRSCELTA